MKALLSALGVRWETIRDGLGMTDEEVERLRYQPLE